MLPASSGIDVPPLLRTLRLESPQFRLWNQQHFLHGCGGCGDGGGFMKRSAAGASTTLRHLDARWFLSKNQHMLSANERPRRVI